MSTKKIFIATGVYPPETGGPATYTKLLEERLPARGFAVNVLPFRAVRHLPKLVRHLAYCVRCLVPAARADIVYAQDTLSVGLPAACAAWLTRRPFVVRVPGDYAWEQARQRFGVTDELDEFQTKRYGRRVELMRAIQRFVVRRANAVVVPSEYMKKIVEGWGAQHVRRIYSSIAAPEPAAIERPDGFLVVSSGRRVPWKHFDAIERVVAREPSWRFFLASDLPRDEALGWVKAADVYVLNSTYEGLSYALVEAMTLGTPVVATAVGGNPELVEGGVTGLLVPPLDDEALYAAIKRVYDDGVGAAARAAQALARAKLFNIDIALEQLTALFNTL